MNLIHVYLMLQLTKHFVSSQDTNRNALELANSTTYEEWHSPLFCPRPPSSFETMSSVLAAVQIWGSQRY